MSCGLSVHDFDNLTPEEFNAIADAAQFRERAAWERARVVAAIIVQPHLRRRVSPQNLLPLPWDKHTKRADGRPKEGRQLTREQARQRFLQLTGEC